MHSFFRLKSAFTLVELLVVIAIIGVLLGLLLPAVQAARSAARHVQCKNNMKQIGLALHNYHDVFQQFPPSKWGTETSTDRKRHHILTFLLPFLEQHSLHEQFDFNCHWNQLPNEDIRKQRLSVFYCPESPRDRTCKGKEYYTTDYTVAERLNPRKDFPELKALFEDEIIKPRSSLLGMLQPPTVPFYDADNNMAYSLPWVSSTASVTDGLSNTLMFFECGGRPFNYEKGRKRSASGMEPIGGADWASNSSPFYIRKSCGSGGMQMFNCNNNNEMYSFHYSGCNFLYGDGAVRFLSETMHPDVFVSHFTPAEGDMTSLD